MQRRLDPWRKNTNSTCFTRPSCATLTSMPSLWFSFLDNIPQEKQLSLSICSTRLTQESALDLNPPPTDLLPSCPAIRTVSSLVMLSAWMERNHSVLLIVLEMVS